MKLALVAAVADNGVIGRDGDMPWHLPDDLRHFKRLTTGRCVVMGRRTFESLRRMLKDRTVVVLTRDPHWKAEGAATAGDLDAALAVARERGEELVLVAGGEAVYAESLPRADVLHLTRVHARPEGDTFFPDFDEREWELVSETPHPADARHAHAFTFQEYRRRR
jgi:dihydrofolate reductase